MRPTSRRITLFVALALGVLGASSESFVGGSDKRREGLGAEVAPDCSTFDVDVAVDLREESVDHAAKLRRIEGSISVHVANPCSVPLEVRYGSRVSYATNFRAGTGEGGPQGACRGDDWSFSGTVPPNQRLPFTLRLRGCRFPLDRNEPPSISIRDGRVVTGGGTKAIPSLTKSLL